MDIRNIIPLLVVGLIGMSGYFLYSFKDLYITETQSNQTAVQNPQQDQINALKKEIDNLKNQKPQVIVEEVQKPRAITKEVQRPSTQENTVLAIEQWRPRVAYIDCSWYGESGLIEEASGSGVLGPRSSDGSFFILTNKHVVANVKGNPATTCNIKFPDIRETYTITADLQKMTMEEISFDPNYDYGNIIIKRPTQEIISLANSKYTVCTGKAKTGEQVLVLGYPGIGSSNDITVTEGIISGYENGYYITSAKVEHGNSGGAAILAKSSCYLGIPSYAFSGKVESLARILDLSSSAPIWLQ